MYDGDQKSPKKDAKEADKIIEEIIESDIEKSTGSYKSPTQ